MLQFTVSAKLCTHCGLCAADCPADVVEALRMVAAGEFNPGLHLDMVGSLDQFSKALGLIKAATVEGKIVLYPQIPAMDLLQKSYRLSKAPRTLCVRVGMSHGHGGPGENPEEIHAMANALLKDGACLARIITSGRDSLNAWVAFESQIPILKAELNYTTDTGQWQKRSWKTIPANLDTKAKRASVVLPKEATVYYFNVVDERNLVVSSEHEEMLPNKPNAGDGK